LVIPNFFYYTFIEWITELEMSDKEKEAYPSYVTCGGYLKSYDHHTAWRTSWDKAELEDRKRVMDLPNWNNIIFKEISGIDVEKELNIRNDTPDTVEVTLEDIAQWKGCKVEDLRIKE